MKRAARAFLALAVLGAAAEARGSVTCDPGVKAVQEVRGVVEGIIAADNGREIDRVMGFYAPDAILMPPGEQPVAGRAAIRPRYEELFSRFDPAIEARIDEACAGDSFAFVRGRNGGRVVARDGSGSRPLDDVYLMLLERDAEGRWRISHLMWHPSDPGAARAAE